MTDYHNHIIDQDQDIYWRIESMKEKNSEISEENYHLVKSLYLIRKQNGRKYGFLQYDFIWMIFRKYMHLPAKIDVDYYLEPGQYICHNCEDVLYGSSNDRCCEYGECNETWDPWKREMVPCDHGERCGCDIE